MLKKLPPILLVFLVTAMVVVAQLGDELLQNPGFDEPGDDAAALPSGWSISAERAHRHELMDLSGNYVLSSKEGAYVLATQQLNLQTGEEYTVSTRFKTFDTGRVGVLLLHNQGGKSQELYLLWNQETEGAYSIASRTFQAPAADCRLYIYDISKTGKVSYDWVSLRPGRPDQAIINHFNLRQIDRQIEEPPVFHHLPTAAPLAGGPIKALFAISSLRPQREVTELSLRLPMVCDVMETNIKKPEALSFQGRLINERLPENFYEVYVVSASLPPLLRRDILSNIHRGAGLVLLDRSNLVSGWKELAPLTEVPETHPLRQVIPLEEHPERDCLAGIQTGTHGAGTIIRLAFDPSKTRLPAIIPQAIDFTTAWGQRQCDYWEDWLGLIAASMLQVSRGDSGLKLSATCDTAADQVRIAVAGDVAPASLRVTFRSSREIRFDQPPFAPAARLRLPPAIHPLAGASSLALPVPDQLPAGPILLEVAALDNRQEVIGWRSFRLERPQAGTITNIALDQPSADQELGLAGVYAPKDSVGATVSVSINPDQPNLSLRSRLLDPYGIVLAQQDTALPIIGGDATVSLPPLPLSLSSTVFLRLEVQLRQNGLEHDRQWVALTVPAHGAKAYDDFAVLPWRPGWLHPFILTTFNHQMRQLGQNVDFPGQGYFLTENGMPGAGYIGSGVFRETRHMDDGIRPKCLNDPEVRQSISQRAQEMGLKHQPFGFVGAGITDEAFLSSHHKTTEFCFCQHCQQGFRLWLQNLYPNIAALNHQWGTSYNDWQEIQPTRSADIRGKANFAPFVDFRTYMTDVWIDACRLITDAYHETNPNTPVGHTNTFGVTPFCGNDYWKLATETNFGWGQEYSEAIKNSGHKAIFELWRSFAKAKFPNYGWLGYNHSRQAANYECWWLALHDAGGVSYYATNSFGSDQMVSWALLTAEQAPTTFGQSIKNSVRDLTHGVGKLLLDYTRDRAEIALFWSHASSLVAWCESSADNPTPNEHPGTDSYGSYFRSALDLRQQCGEMQLTTDYVAAQQILDRSGLTGRKILLLPFTVAFPADLTTSIYDFINAGGIVIGDLRCLRTDSHGKAFDSEAQPLARIFGVQRPDGAAVDYSPSEVTINRSLRGIGTTGATLATIGREQLQAAADNPAVAIATHADGTPAIFIRPLGRGLSIYLNFRLAEYDLGTRALLAQIAAAAGIISPAVVTNADATTPPRSFELNTFRRENIAVHAFIRDFRRVREAEAGTAQLTAPAYLYNIRQGQFLGRSDQIALSLQPGETALFAAMPYQVEQLVATAKEDKIGTLQVSANLTATEANAPLGHHIVRCEITDPDGLTQPPWQINVAAPQGRLNIAVPVGINRKKGLWKLALKDVLTGTNTKLTVTLE